MNLAALTEVIEDARKVGMQRLFETLTSEAAIVAKYNRRVLHVRTRHPRVLFLLCAVEFHSLACEQPES